MKRFLVGAIAVLFIGSGAVLGQPLTSAFTYQGELVDAGSPANGSYDFRFRLYDASTGGAQQGATLCADNVAVSAGRFTVLLDFGTQFTGQRRWLEVEVRPDTGLDCSGSGAFTLLMPRQELTATPNAAFALDAVSATTAGTATNATQLNGQPASFYQNAANLASGTLPDARLAGTYSSALTLTNPANSFTGNGSGLTNLSASNIASGLLSLARGGTGANLSSTGGPGRVVKQSTPGGPLTVGLLSAGELPLLAGDVAGMYDSNTVARIQGRAVSPSAPLPDYVLKWNSLESQWAPAPDANTMYIAGDGLALTGATFSIAPGGVSSAMLGAGSVTGGAGGIILDSSVASADLAFDAASLNKVSNGTLFVSGANISATGNMIANEFNYTTALTSYYMVSQPAFASFDAVPVAIGGFGAFPTASAPNGLVAQVNLPHGCTIRGATYYFYDNSGTSDLTFTLVAQNATSTGVIILHSGLTSTGASTAVRSLSVSGMNITVDNANQAYQVFVIPAGSWSGSSMTVKAVRIEYTLPRPAR